MNFTVDSMTALPELLPVVFTPQGHDRPHPDSSRSGGATLRNGRGVGALESERIVGEALRPVRDDVVMESKFVWNIDPATGAITGLNSRPNHIRQAVDGLLKRRPRCRRSSNAP
ncbi:hypothetical protein ACFXMT_11275 [Streptomyces mirabilis]|uniref:hypothetical protein n=1 Tax=Streptomyces mirabilis TaxID=68239 RepID=UPI00369BE1CA